jgi:cytochrome c-type biogenesis protein
VHLNLIGLFGAGLLTFLSPCVLPLIPIYLALFLEGTVSRSSPPRASTLNPEGNLPARAQPKRKLLEGRFHLLINTLFFSFGMLIVFIALGLTATSIGVALAEHKSDLILLGGLIIFLFGLKYLGVLKLNFLDREKRLDDSRVKTRYGWLNAIVMGLVFSLGWTPCIGPVLASVLTYTASKASSAMHGAMLLAIYGAGLVFPLIILSLLGDSARAIVSKLSPLLPRLEKVTGLLLVGVGLFLIFDVVRPPAATFTPSTTLSQKSLILPPLGKPTSHPRLIEFYSPDCSICRQMIPTIGVIERDCGGKKVDVVKVDVSQKEFQELARSYQIRGVPTFIFLDKKGEVASRLVGYQTLYSLRQSLAVLVGEECEGVGLFHPGPDTCKDSPGARCGG